MKRSRLLFLLPSLLLASCWQRETVHSSSEPSGVESVFTYAFHESPDQQDSLLGLWDLGYFSNAISSAFPLKDKKDFYFAGDVISIRSSEPLLTQETFPATHILPEGAEIYSVSIRSARIEEIPVAELTETKEGKYVYRGEEVLSSNVVLSRTLQYAPLSSYSKETVYASFAPSSGESEGKTIAGLYAFDPRWINDKNPTYFASLEGMSTVLGEQGGTIDAEIYEPQRLRAFYRDGFVSAEEEFSFAYDEEAFDLFANPESDPRWVSYTIIPKKLGSHSFLLSWRGCESRYDIKVDASDLKAVADFPCADYPEFNDALENMGRHSSASPYPGLEECPFPNNGRDEVSFSFETYDPSYSPYLFDDCYFPVDFPSAPRSPIMTREISFTGSPGALASFSIVVGEIDPGCTNPQDPVSFAKFTCAPKKHRYAYSVHPAYEAALAYGLFNPAPKKINGIDYSLLKAGPSLYAFFEDETYAYSMAVSYATDRS